MPHEELDPEVVELLEEMGPFDIVAGINTKDTETTIIHVLNVVCEGLQNHFPDKKALVVVADGHSEDQTVALARFYPTPRGIRKVVVPQAFGPGKGNGIRTIFEVARRVDAQSVAFVDGDLVSIRPIWVDNLLRPVMYGLADLVVPYYLRDKWDGVITNHLCYPFTAALYGTSVRQPIGGDFGVSRAYMERLINHPMYPGHFGIDIFLTTVAIAEGYRLQEAPLGIKIHASTTGYTDPRKVLSRMYLEVVGSLLDLAAHYEKEWRRPDHQHAVLVSEKVVPYYDRLPQATTANPKVTREIFQEGVAEYGKLLDEVLDDDLRQTLSNHLEDGLEKESWVRMVNAIAAWYIVHKDGDQQEDLLHALGALGMGRFLKWVEETNDADLKTAYGMIQEQAVTFQQNREDLIRRVDELRAKSGKTA